MPSLESDRPYLLLPCTTHFDKPSKAHNGRKTRPQACIQQGRSSVHYQSHCSPTHPHRQSLGVPCLQDTRYQSEHDCSLNMLCIVLIAQTGIFHTQSEQQFTAESICRGRLARRDLILQKGCTARVLSAVNVTDQQCQHAMTLSAL